MTSSIVTTHYRYKRPPRKRKTVALEAPAVVTAKSSRRPNLEEKAAPDLTPEEHQRRGEAADALWRELVRRATAKP